MAKQAGYDALMHYVCVGLGYCGCSKDGWPLHVDFLIPPYGPVTADQFAEWVLLAENMNPNTTGHREAIREAFVHHMGSEVVDAARLRYDFDRKSKAE